MYSIIEIINPSDDWRYELIEFRQTPNTHKTICKFYDKEEAKKVLKALEEYYLPRESKC